MKTRKNLAATVITLLLVRMLFTDPVFSQGSVRCFEFQTGMDSYMQLGAASSINFSRQTVEAWIYIFPFSGKKEAVFSNGTDCNILVRDTLSGSWYFIEYQLKIAGVWMIQRSKTHLVKNVWYHLAVAYDGYSMTIFINGNPDNLSGVSNKTYTNFQASSNYYIGDSPDSRFQNFTGLIDEVRIWSAPVEQPEILYWMRTSLTSLHPGWNNLERYYKCDDTGVTILPGTYCSVREEKKNLQACTYGVVSRNYTQASVYKKSYYQFTESFESYVSPKTLGIYFNGSLHEFSSHNHSPYVMKMKGTVDLQNNVTMTGSSGISVGAKYELPGACCLFRGKLAYVSLKDIDEVPDVANVTEVWHHMGSLEDDGDVTRNCVSRHLRICVPPAYAVLNDTLYFFNITNDNGTIKLNVDWSIDGINFTFLRTINTTSTGLDYYFGNVAACTFRDNDGREVIFVGYPDRNHTGIQLKRFYRAREVDESFIPVDKVRNFSMVSGNVEGGVSNGYTLQLFYSAGTADNFGHGKTIGRIEYSVEDKFAYPAEQLNIEGYDKDNGELEHRRFRPYAFACFQTEGASNEILRQKIILTVQNNYQNYKTDWYLCWNSNRINYESSSDVSDTNPGDKVSRLLGIIEGPPPYVLNKYPLSGLVNAGSYPSSLIFGSSTGSSQENTVALDKSWKTSIVIHGLAEDFERHLKTVTQSSFSSVEYENRTVFPVTGRDMGYKVFLRPVVTRKKFRLTDGNGHFLDNIYTFSITERFIDYVPYYLDTVAFSPQPKKFSSWLNRGIDFNGYNKIYSANYSWTGGSGTETGFQTDSTVSVSTEEKIYNATGNSYVFNVIATVIVGISSLEFSLETRTGATSIHEGTVSLKSCRNISVRTSCPFTGSVGDTSHFTATVYWLRPTDGKNNWWIPKGYELHKPWCITYKVNSISTVFPSVGNPLPVDDSASPETFMVYPNPASRYITVSLPATALNNTNLTVYNMLGSVVKQCGGQCIDGKRQVNIPIGGLPDGVYMINATGNGRKWNQSFMIRK